MLNKLDNETFGQYIARLRKLKNYSQRKLATESGVSNTTISRIENGETPNPDLPTLQALAASLGVEEVIMLSAAGYLNTTKNTGNDDLSTKDLRQIELEIEKMIAGIKNNPDEAYSQYGGDTNVSEEDMELLLDSLRTAHKVVRKLNKQTYTPNKYKNKEE